MGTKEWLGGYYHGRKETGIFYRLITTEAMDGNKYYAVLRYYGKNNDGTPMMDVSIVGVDDGTIDSYAKAHELYMLLCD